MEALPRLQGLFRELFQLELADLDFGLYRLLHIKRDEVEAFLSEQLPRRVSEAFQAMSGEEGAALQREVSSLAERIRSEVADEALMGDGEVSPEYKNVKTKAARKLIEEYEAKRAELKAVQITEGQQAEVFNHLYAFFSRYYEAGDFIPKRHYGAREHYAVPYNGEEVFFHWANKDQHYVKTGEAFRDYAFGVETLQGPYRVRFVLAEASLPPGNVKGDTRYFFPLPDRVSWDDSARELRIPFEYRLPTEQEVLTHGKNSRLQDGVLQSALPKIVEAVPDSLLASVLSEAVEQKEDQPVSLLLKRLRHFCRRNTTDYFIHKNLKGFLSQELEFYIKDQLLHLADLEGDFEGKRRVLRVMRQLAGEVITFLDQIEDVQKRLFEKRKFVLRTDYLVPIKEVPKDLWKEVLANKAQIEAWKTLFHIEPKVDLFNKKGTVNLHFLEQHPTLVVNTSHFDSDFKDKLLSAFEDLDEATDGLLIHSENYQALRLLERKYAGKVKCIYIDPPYNTGSDEFIYKDRYRHSSWLAMMEERLRASRKIVAENGTVFISIDDNELNDLRFLLDGVYGQVNFVAQAVWQKVYSPRMDAKGYSQDHDYLPIYSSWGRPNVQKVAFEQRLAQFSEIEKETGRRYRKRSLRKEGKNSRRIDRPNLYYPLVAPDGSQVLPIRPDGSEGRWRWSTNKYEEAKREGIIEWIKSGGRWQVYVKQFHSEKAARPPSTLWLHTEAGHNHEAAEEIKSLFKEMAFQNPKPTRLVARILEIATGAENDDVILDFFAGSGTTGHAVIGCNRKDGGSRRFVLVEFGDHFQNILLPRIEKVMFSPEWKEAQPKRVPTPEEVDGTPRLVKILRLESYEDALHNLVTDKTRERESPRAEAHKKALGGDAYRLSYLVRLPLESSSTFLNVEALEHPFDYRIEVLTENGPREEEVDLVETFNYLYGLHVTRMEMWENREDGRDYRAVKGTDRNNRKVLVLWRDMKDLDPKAERKFLEKKIEEQGPFDEVFANGDTATPGVKSLDGLFKRLMEEGEGK
jgi:adenine-specific DNA-methyltransferase